MIFQKKQKREEIRERIRQEALESLKRYKERYKRNDINGRNGYKNKVYSENSGK